MVSEFKGNPISVETISQLWIGIISNNPDWIGGEKLGMKYFAWEFHRHAIYALVSNLAGQGYTKEDLECSTMALKYIKESMIVPNTKKGLGAKRITPRADQMLRLDNFFMVSIISVYGGMVISQHTELPELLKEAGVKPKQFKVEEPEIDDVSHQALVNVLDESIPREERYRAFMDSLPYASNAGRKVVTINGMTDSQLKSMFPDIFSNSQEVLDE